VHPEAGEFVATDAGVPPLAVLHRANNFDFVRFVAASLVLVSHCYALTGRGGDEPLAGLTHGRYTLGGLAVRVFFVISGFLVCQSWTRRPQAIAFVVARSLRIFPGFAVALLFTVMLGLAVGTLPPSDYLRQPGTWDYFWNNLTLQTEFYLPGVFEDNIFPRTVNGSIWSLRYEVRAYLVVLGLGVLTLLRPGPVGLFGWGAAVACIWQAPWLWGILVRHDFPVIHLFLSFVFAALVALNPKALRHCGWFALACAVLLATVAKGRFVDYCVDGLLCAGVLWFVHRPLPAIRDWARHGDFSYGMFIYAFPLQQSIAYALRPEGQPYLMMLLAFPATLAVSVLSWRTVENPCIALKGPIARRLQAGVDALRARFVGSRR
jgi:peptidoglycan/LPS O-acetylase OafA/YrhL